MLFALGLLSGVVVTFVGFVVVMAPKHWDWYQQLKEQAETIRKLAEERDHYKSMSYPSEWGPVEQFEDRIIPAKSVPYDDVDAGPIEHRFDDILDGGK